MLLEDLRGIELFIVEHATKSNSLTGQHRHYLLDHTYLLNNAKLHTLEPNVWAAPPGQAVPHVATGDKRSTEATIMKQLHDNYGAPESTWLKVSVGADGVSLDAQVLLVEKTSTRMMEAMFLTFAPSRNCDWSMDKLGEFVGAKDVMMGGSGGVSSIGSGVMCSLNGTAVDGKQQQRMFVRSLDSAVVHWGSDTAGPSMLPTGQGQGAAPWTQSEADVSAGAHCVLFDNLWNTNYIFWWPYLKSTSAANIVYRFRMCSHDRTKKALVHYFASNEKTSPDSRCCFIGESDSMVSSKHASS